MTIRIFAPCHYRCCQKAYNIAIRQAKRAVDYLIFVGHHDDDNKVTVITNIHVGQPLLQQLHPSLAVTHWLHFRISRDAGLVVNPDDQMTRSDIMFTPTVTHTQNLG